MHLSGNSYLSIEIRSGTLWLCGILGEAVKNAVKVACIAIFIKAMQSVMLIQAKSSELKILISRQYD